MCLSREAAFSHPTPASNRFAYGALQPHSNLFPDPIQSHPGRVAVSHGGADPRQRGQGQAGRGVRAGACRCHIVTCARACVYCLVDHVTAWHNSRPPVTSSHPHPHPTPTPTPESSTDHEAAPQHPRQHHAPGVGRDAAQDAHLFGGLPPGGAQVRAPASLRAAHPMGFISLLRSL
jgi:hypothetical protein